MAMVVPVLLTLGQPVRLALEAMSAEPGAAPGRSSPLSGRATRALTDPANGLALSLAVLVALYATPLLDLALRDVLVHLLGNALAFAARPALVLAGTGR